MDFKKDVPWYRNSEYYFNLADRYIFGARKIARTNQLAQKELTSFEEFNVINLIFESNLIEGAGAKTRGETEEIIRENGLVLPEEYQAFKEMAQSEKVLSRDNVRKIKESLAIINKNRSIKINPSVQFEGKSRIAIEVIRHQAAWRYSMFLAYKYVARERLAQIRDFLRENKEDFPGRKSIEEMIGAFLKGNDVKRVRRMMLFSEGNVKNIHKKLGYGQISKSSRVEAGQYRIHDAHIDNIIKFPSPDLLKSCMSGFSKSSQKYIDDYHSGNLNIYELAARISYDFVSIHPFPDFNGRTSRILMNMALKLSDPRMLPISLRGDARSKKNYFYSLTLCGRGNYMPFSALIAKRVCEIYQLYDDNLKKAGITDLLSLSAQQSDTSETMA